MWVYDLDPTTGDVSNKRLLMWVYFRISLPVIDKFTSGHLKWLPVKNDFRSFEDGGLADGMRCDSLGNIYVTRWGIGEIWKISPDGRLLRTIKTKGKNLTNVAFGGTDGKTIFVTVPDRGIIEYFRVEDPGIPLS